MIVETQTCTVTFPGLLGIESASYTCPDGIRPGHGAFSVAVEPAGLPRYGPVRFSDGHRTYVVPNCRIESVSANLGASGFTWRVEFSDRRWAWEHALIDGEYNKPDTRGNLIPGTVRSPKELAELCLERLGERGYTVDLPEGVKEEDGPPNFNPEPGTGLKSIRPELNPYVNWLNMPAAEALARVCDQFDRRIIYDPLTDRVRILKAYEGAALPDDHVETASGSLALPPMPTGMGIISEEPIRFQLRFLLEAVAQEWDGRFVRIDDVSYAPTREPCPKLYIVLLGVFNSSAIYLLTVNGVTFSATGFGSEGTTLANLASQVNANPHVSRFAVATYSTSEGLHVRGVNNGSPVTVSATATEPGSLLATVVHPGRPGKWDLSHYPEFPCARETDRLSWKQAVNLAKASVFRCFRLTALDPQYGPHERQQPLYISGVGYLAHRYMVQLLPEKVEQIAPDPRDPNRVLHGQEHIIADIPDYYDGWSRGRSPEVFGSTIQAGASVYQLNSVDSGAMQLESSGTPDKSYWNTRFGNRVEVPFTLDPANQMVRFESPVPQWSVQNGLQFTLAPRLVLETACYLLDPETRQPYRYRRWIKFGAQRRDQATGERERPTIVTRLDNDRDVTDWDRDPGIQWFVHKDVIRSRITRYNVDNANKKHIARQQVEFDEYDNARQAAGHYLTEHLKRIVTTGGEQRTYAGVALIPLDGAIRMLRISFSAGGMTTVASRNYEADLYIPSHKIRRFREGLEPAALAIQQNREMFPVERRIYGAVSTQLGHLGYSVR
jgi:hypothetical protein